MASMYQYKHQILRGLFNIKKNADTKSKYKFNENVSGKLSADFNFKAKQNVASKSYYI